MTEAKFGAIEKNTAQIGYCWAHLRLSDYIMLISNWVFKMKNNQVPRKTLATVWVLSSNKQGNLKLTSRYIHSFTHPPSTQTAPSFCKTGTIVATKLRWEGFYVRTTDNLWLPCQLPYLTNEDNSFSGLLPTKLIEMKWGIDIYFVNYKGTLIKSIK